MKRQYNRDKSVSILDLIEGAVAEKEQRGCAEVAHFGFAAEVANATPPLDGTFQQALRSRLIVEANASIAQEARLNTGPKWRSLLNLGRFSFRGALVTALVLALVFVVIWYIRGPFGIGEQALTVSSLDQSDVDALAQRVNEDSAARAVVVFPPDYALSLGEQIQRDVVPLAVDENLTPQTIRAALGTILPTGGLVDVILVQQENNAFIGEARAALERTLYRLYRPGESGVEIFGTLQHFSYVARPGDASLESSGVVFENGIELLAASVLDDPQAGMPLCIAFDWRLASSMEDTAPVEDEMIVFAHIMLDGALLIAQRDAVPGNGEFPVTDWKPGEIVRDQFALLLPEDLPTGEYEIYVGIYNPASGMRYRVVDTAGAEIGQGGTVTVIRRFTIQE